VILPIRAPAMLPWMWTNPSASLPEQSGSRTVRAEREGCARECCEVSCLAGPVVGIVLAHGQRPRLAGRPRPR